MRPAGQQIRQRGLPLGGIPSLLPQVVGEGVEGQQGLIGSFYF